MKKTDIQIVMGSDSDAPIMQHCVEILKKFKATFDIHVLSAHRTPHEVSTFASQARKRGTKVIIAGAGGAAHLAGVIAAHTTLPVIGIPLASSDLKGLDALLATVQMPAGVPVATVAIGKAGAVNAALLALQILSLTDSRMRNSLEQHKKDMTVKVKQKNQKIKTIKMA